MAHIYAILTDSGSMDDFEAENIADALDQFDAPRSVRSVAAFEAWLERVGGYGWIEQDGVLIAEVKS